MEKIENHQKIVVYAAFILVAFILGAWILFRLIGILFVWLIAFILMTALNPFVEWLEHHHVPRALGVLLVFVGVISVFSLVVVGLTPPLIRETTSLIASLSRTFDYSNFVQFDVNFLTSQIQTLSQSALNVIKFISSAASNIFAVVSLVVITVYMLMERHRLKRYLKYIFRNGNGEKQAEIMLSSIETQLGGWVRGELLLMAIIGVMSYLGLSLMRIPYALPLALLAALCELIPNIGPIISAIPAILFGYSIAPVLAIAVAVLFIFIHQSENHLIVPFVMKQSTGLDPLVTLFCLTVGATLGGIAGAVLAVPLFITGDVVVKSFYYSKKIHE